MAKRPLRALLVDDDELFCLAVSHMLSLEGVEITVAGSLAEARATRPSSFDVVILDDGLPDGRGLDLFPLIGAQRVVAISADPDVDMAIAALRHHAIDFLTKPVELRRLRRSVLGAEPEPELEGHSEAMSALKRELLGFARAEAPVLLLGETGTGKTRSARWIHDHSARAAGPFVPVNCGALPPNLIESELFGVERGAFTGASEARRGLLEAADGGTFFLDEIGELPAAAQAKLLDVIEGSSVRRVGGRDRRPVDIRFVAATHVDLEREVGRGRFRRDLLYRLDVLTAALPPLRAQADGLALLVDELLDELGCSRRLAEGELARLARHDWPGNIRELRNLLYRCTVLQTDGRLAPSTLLPKRALSEVGASAGRPVVAPRSAPAVPATLEEVALRHMVDVAKVSPTRKHAAELLGIGESTLRRKLKQAEQLGLV